MVNMADTVQSTAAKKIASAGALVDYSNRILFNILKAPYNFYSPVLEAEEIERIRNEKFDYESIDYSYKPFKLRDSSKVKLDIRSMSWVADDGSRTNIPFGISQIQYEIIAPIVSNLLKDTKKERMEIYNHIKDQKLSYLNKWHQDTEDFYGRNRAEAADIINLMRSTLSEYSAAYNTLVAYKKTEESMNAAQTLESAITEATDNSAEVLVGYQTQAQQVAQTQKEFSEYMDRLHEDIDARAEKFGYVEYYDASLRDKKARDIAVAAGNVAMLDDRRRPLAEVNPLLAQNSELLPAPNIEETAYQYAGINLNAVAKESLEDLNMQRTSSNVVPSTESAEQAEDVDDSIQESAIIDLNEDNLNGADINDTVHNESDDDNDQDVTLDDVEQLIEELLEYNTSDKTEIQAIATRLLSLKEAFENEQETDDLTEQLIDLYNDALEIEEQLSNNN